MIVLGGEGGPVRHMEFTADGRHLTAAFANANGIEFWGLATRRRERVVAPDTRVPWYVLHPAGRWAYAELWSRAWSELALLDLQTGKQFGRKCVAFGGLGVAASRDGTRVIASTRTDLFPRTQTPTRADTQHWLMCWRHAGSTRPKMEWERQRTIREAITYHIAFFPAGDRIAAYEARVWGPAKRHRSQIAVRDAPTGAYLQRADCEGAEAVVVSPDGTRIVTRWGEKLQVWDAADLRAGPRTITEGRNPGWYLVQFEGRSFAFHPSGKYLAATGNDHEVRLYHAADWRVAETYVWDVGRTRSVAFSPDGSLAAVGGDSGEVVVWDMDV